MHAPSSTRGRAAIALLALALALAPGLAGLTAADGHGPPSDGDRASPPEEGNESRDGEQGNRSDGDAASGDRSEPSENRGGPEDRPGADPVQIEDRPGGFATRAPQGSPRPTVAVDASEARANVERDDVRELTLQVDALVAHLDEDGDAAYDLGEPVVERIGLHDLDHEIVADPANETRTLAYQLPRGGSLELVFDVGADHGAEVGAKVDVRVTGYTPPDPDARLALGARVEVPGGVEVADVDRADALAGRSGEAVPYVSWADTVQVDGSERDVGTSVHVSATPDEASEGSSALVYWSYPQGEHIVHDPTLGVTDAVRDLPGQAWAFAIGLAATLVILGAGYAVRRRVRL